MRAPVCRVSLLDTANEGFYYWIQLMRVPVCRVSLLETANEGSCM